MHVNVVHRAETGEFRKILQLPGAVLLTGTTVATKEQRANFGKILSKPEVKYTEP